MLAVILVDALDKSYFTQKRMPFLFNLAKNNLLVKTYLPLIGFEHRQYLLWSKTPEELGVFSSWLFDPENSPFRFIKKYVKILNRFEKYHKITSLIRLTINKSLKKNNIMRIPFKFAPYFNTCPEVEDLIKKNQSKSLLEILHENNLSFEYLWFPFKKDVESDEKRINRFFSLLQTNSPDVFFLHLSALDRIGHKHGHEFETINTVKKIDSVLKKIISHKKVQDFIIFGDHGMAEVNNQINIGKDIIDQIAVRKLDKNLVYFIDSSMVRFWTKDRTQVLNFLNQYKNQGYIMDEKLRRKYQIKFEDNAFGDVIFFLKKGYVFTPNFFSMKKVKGMHGHLPEENPSIMVCSSKKKKLVKTANDLDFAPTVLDMLKLDNYEEFAGQSVLRK